jgi:cell wall-associated NlpC family hydrolase
VPAWAWGSGASASQGDIAANWGLTQLGKPYQWGAADPSTIHHVGIDIGNGMMVDAPFTGAFVRIDSMYQPGGLIGAVRPAG